MQWAHVCVGAPTSGFVGFYEILEDKKTSGSALSLDYYCAVVSCSVNLLVARTFHVVRFDPHYLTCMIGHWVTYR